VDYSFACSGQDVTDGQALVGCFLGEFTAGSQALLTLAFIPTAAQNLSVSGQLVFDNGDMNADGDAANNIADSCMNMVSARPGSSLLSTARVSFVHTSLCGGTYVPEQWLASLLNGRWERVTPQQLLMH
jgi:hypothetical protein